MTSILVQAGCKRPRQRSDSPPSNKQASQDRLIGPVTCALCLAPFSPLLLPDDRVITDSVFCDYESFQLPIREFARQELFNGRFPLWIPYLGCGTPLHATQQAALCHPILTPLIFALGANAGTKVALFLHVALAFAGAYRLARDLSVSRWGASLAGMVVTWGAFAVLHFMVGHVTIILEYAMVPWFFVALGRLLRSPGPRPCAAFSLATGLMVVSGQPQILYYTLLFGLLWAIGSLSSGVAARSRISCIGWGGAAMACAGLLGAVQLLPAWELSRDGLSESERGSLDYASRYAMSAGDLARLVVPNAAGNPLRGIDGYEKEDFFHERIGYLGILPLLLAAFGVARASSAPWQKGACGLVLFGLTIALGKNTPLFDLLGRAIPGLLLFRCPGRIFSVLTPLIAALAGRGLDAWTNGERIGWANVRWFVLATLCVHWLIVTGGGTAPLCLPCSDYFDFARHRLLWEFAGSLLAIVTAVSILAVLSRRLPATCCYLAAMMATALDLADHSIANSSLEPRQTLAASHKCPGTSACAGNDAVRVIDSPDLRFPHGALSASRIVPFLVGQRVTSVVTNEGGVLPSSLGRLHRAIERAPSVALSLAACNRTCSPSGDLWELLPRALPRIRIVGEKSRDLVSTQIEEMNPLEVESLRNALMGNATITHEDPQTIELDAFAPEKGVLVVADLFCPGWQCEIDGHAVTIEPAHGVFRAVDIKQGKHRVRFYYHSSAFRFGAWCSLAGLAIVGVLGATKQRHKLCAGPPYATRELSS